MEKRLRLGPGRTSGHQKILMYSHDCNGLGHTSRTLSIAAYLAAELEQTAIMLMTDLSIIGRFAFPKHVDFIHLPCIFRQPENSFYDTHLNIELKNILTLRRKITKSAIKTFQPEILLIEADPTVLPQELKHTFGFVRKRYPGTRVVWGLPDILGDPETVIREWIEKDVYRVLHRVCDEIWVHGEQSVFDLVSEYDFPPELAAKTIYTGYMQISPLDAAGTPEGEMPGSLDQPYVLVTAGSGVEGYALIDNYLRFLESAPEPPFRSVIITGPMMKSEHKRALLLRAENLPGVIFHRYSKHILKYLQGARLVVCNGGFNMLCEILSYRKKSIFVPSPTPANEHLKRAQIFKDLGLIDIIFPEELNPHYIGHKIGVAMPGPVDSYPEQETAYFPQLGMETILERVRALSREIALSAFRISS